MTSGFEPTFMTTVQWCLRNRFRCSSDTGGCVLVSYGKDISSHLKLPKVFKLNQKRPGFRMCLSVAAILISYQKCLVSTLCKHLHKRNHLTTSGCGVLLLSSVTNPHPAVLPEHTSYHIHHISLWCYVGRRRLRPSRRWILSR